MFLPNDIFTKILEERKNLMLKDKAHLNFKKCMNELEELTDQLVMDIQMQVDQLENEIDEEYYEELLNYSFSELLIENIINSHYLNS